MISHIQSFPEKTDAMTIAYACLANDNNDRVVERRR